MKSILFSSFVDKSLFLTHFEFSLFYHEEIIGEYQLTFEYDKVTLSIFQIKEDFRGKGLSKLALQEIDKQILSFSTLFEFSTVQLTARHFNNSLLNNNDLVVFYEKYFGMVVDYADRDEIFMKKCFSVL